jgi:exopolysaccharide biosynthesis polyprenyl glycosylphosphotransferase
LLDAETHAVAAPHGASAVESLHTVDAVTARRRRRRAGLIVADVAAAAIAFTVATDGLWPAALVLLPLVVVLARLFGLYERDALVIRATTVEEVPALFRLGALCTLLVWLSAGPLLDVPMSAMRAFVLWTSFVVLALGLRHVAREAVRRLSPPERLMLVGDEGVYRRLRDMLDNANTDARLVGRLSLAPAAGDAVAPTPPDETALAALVRDLDAHRLVIEPSQTDPDTTLAIVRTAQALGLRVTLVPQVLDVVGHAVVFDDLFGLTVLGVQPVGLRPEARLAKRLFDLTGSVVGLVLTAPAFLILAAAIKLDSRGPVLLRQERVGRDGHRFRMLKFRAMVATAQHEEPTLAERDPRLTRVGSWLRRTSLDELPQLVNVLRGQMSLVGPRPLIVREDEAIQGLDRHRLRLTPGITGPWQVAGATRMPLAEMVKLDYLYVTTWSLFGDVKLLARTVPYLVARRGSTDGSQRPLI